LADGGLPAGGRQPEQHRRGDLGGGGQVLVAGQLGGEQRPDGWTTLMSI
jgi:hypothetical protein